MSESHTNRTIHLDVVGGIAGDMFVAAMLDAFPNKTSHMIDCLNSSDLLGSIEFHLKPFNDHTLRGSRFCVQIKKDHTIEDNISFSILIKKLSDSELPINVIAIAKEVFTRLASAEATVHGIDLDNVYFHEVGAWDSIADIVASAYLIDSLTPCSWSISSIPLGKGTIKCQHGSLPVPAPATLELLKGYYFHNDDYIGERVTPTGAAIISYLNPSAIEYNNSFYLKTTGIGFGQRTFPGMSNILRILEFENIESSLSTDKVAVIKFEVDDQTSEDLGIALDNLRACNNIIDVLQIPAIGKKGRMVSQIQILGDPNNLQAISTACFKETTTLGLRWSIVERNLLDRIQIEDSSGIEVKIAKRPRGMITAKAGSKYFEGNQGGHSKRQTEKTNAENAALRKHHDE